MALYKTAVSLIEFSETKITFDKGIPHLVPADTLPPFQIRVSYAEGGSYSFAVIDKDDNVIYTIPNGDVDGRQDPLPDTEFLYWTYNGGAQVIGGGEYRYRYRRNPTTGDPLEIFSEPFLIGCDVDHFIEWWNDCDVDDTIFQFGFKNRMYFKLENDFPELGGEEDAGDQDGISFFRSYNLRAVYQAYLHTLSEYSLVALKWIRYAKNKDIVKISTGERNAIKEYDIRNVENHNNEALEAFIEYTLTNSVGNGCCDNKAVEVAFSS